MVNNQKSMLLLAGAVALAIGCGGGAANAADPFALTSSTFKDGTMLQKKNAGNRAGSPNCVGENVSPPLAWSNAPASTRSFALTMTDPEGRGGAGVFHWVAYGIPASVTSFAEGEVSKDSDKYVGGKSSQGVGHYSGPCTPPGSPHHYTFILIATDLDPKALPPGLTNPELHAKLAGHAKGSAGLIGLWTKPAN
jgi:Raf kinase inhibitor-like YbhB/YbcL family protein